jgi:hypothetical protein
MLVPSLCTAAVATATAGAKGSATPIAQLVCLLLQPALTGAATAAATTTPAAAAAAAQLASEPAAAPVAPLDAPGVVAAAAVFVITLAGMGRSLCSCFQCVRRLNTVKKHCTATRGIRQHNRAAKRAALGTRQPEEGACNDINVMYKVVKISNFHEVDRRHH